MSLFIRQRFPTRRFAKIAGWRRRFPGIEWIAMFDVVGIGLNAIDYLCCVPRYPVPGEKLRMTGFSRRGGGQVGTALVALSRWGERDPGLRPRPGDIPREEIRRSRAVFIDGHDVPASLESARVARGAGVPVVLDAEKVQEGTEELLGLCDHIVAASSFVGPLFPGMDPAFGVREIYRSFSPRTATVTLGAGGAAGLDGRDFVAARGIR